MRFLSICFFWISLFSFPALLVAQTELTLDEAILERWSTFRPESMSQLSWIPQTDSYAYLKENNLIIGSPKKGDIQTLVNLEDLNRGIPQGIEALQTFPRIEWTAKEHFQFNHKGQLLSYDLKNGLISIKNDLPSNAENRDVHRASGNIAFTRDNNLFVQIDDIGEKQITNLEQGIVAGQAIARSEFGIVKGTFWSPSGNHLAFYQKDERGVGQYALMNYDETPAQGELIRYPMAGQQGELASAGIYNSKTGTTTYLEVEGGKQADSFYITNLTWSPDEKHIYLAIVNRDQNEMYLGRWNAETGKEEVRLFSESDAEYVEPERGPIFVNGKSDTFLWFSERDGFDHLYLYKFDGSLKRQITRGSFDMLDYQAADKRGKNIFVSATGPNPTERHLYKVTLSNGSMYKVTKEAGTHSVQVNDAGSCIIDQFSSIEVPNQQQIIGANGKVERVLLKADNPLDGKTMATTEIFSRETSDSTTLWCRMIKPSNFDPNQQYPVLVYLYNGPHAQMVRNTWLGAAPMWMHWMAEQGYVIFTVDGRGSAHRGIDFEQAIFRNLGELEMSDQIEMVNWLKAEPYTDSDRFAVHGWSYGGFMTTSLMLRHPDVFKVGVAGGPVTDWKYYEVMYGERYMDSPESNPEGYENTRLSKYVDNLEGDLLLIHGTSDPVVVMQHSMTLIEAFVSAGQQVDFFPYPGHPHNVRGKDRVHLMRKVLTYIDDKLKD